jgi:hypothetical protein
MTISCEDDFGVRCTWVGVDVQYDLDHGLMNYLDTKAKCRHLKKLT